MRVKIVSVIWGLNTSKEILFGNRMGDRSAHWCLIVNPSWCRGLDLLVSEQVVQFPGIRNNALLHGEIHKEPDRIQNYKADTSTSIVRRTRV